MGRVVRPWLQSAETGRRIAELTAPAADPGLDPGSPAVIAATPEDSGGTAALAPGAVEVRLLTMSPRLEGLHEDLPRTGPDGPSSSSPTWPCTNPTSSPSDRLRTRVLGSSDSDAASKTLFNTAHAARRAMGVDE